MNCRLKRGMRLRIIDAENNALGGMPHRTRVCRAERVRYSAATALLRCNTLRFRLP